MTEERMVIFKLGSNDFALPLLKLKEVIAVPKISPVPGGPDHLLGLMDIRGDIVPVFQLHKRLKIAANKINAEPAIIICEIGSERAGFIVDSVDCVISVATKDLPDTGNDGTNIERRYVSGVIQREECMVLKLDVDRAIGKENLAH